MRRRLELPCDSSRIRDGLDFIKEALKERNVSSKDITRTVLTSEEVLAKLISNATDSDAIRISVTGHFGNVKIIFKAKGSAFSALDIEQQLLFEQEDEEANEALRRLLDKILDDRLHIANSNGVNTAVIKALSGSQTAAPSWQWKPALQLPSRELKNFVRQELLQARSQRHRRMLPA